MGQYVINGDSGYNSIPVSDFGNQSPTYSSVALLGIPVDPGTSTNPITLWKGKGAKINCYAQGADFIYPIDRMTGSSISGSTIDSSPADLTLNLYIGAYSYMSGSTKMLRVFYYVTYSEAAVIAALTNGIGNQNTLYQNTYAIAEESLFSYDASWDETPDASGGEDPERMGPQGGEFADRGAFGITDDIDIPAEAQEVSLSGFITMYSMDQGELSAVGTAIFTSNTWQNLRNKFDGVGDPIQYIISAVEVPTPPITTASKNFNLGGIDIETSGGNKIPVHYTISRYRNLTFGSLTLKETWGSEKDYSQTSISIYLPYIGVKDLDPEVIMNSTLTLKGCIDISNGDLFYALLVSKKQRPGVYVQSSGVAYRFQGNAGRQIPVGKADNTGQLAAMFGGMASMGVGLATGNAMAAFGGAGALIGSAAVGQKVSMASGAGGSIGRADVQSPYLIITQKVPVYPNKWRQHFGAPRYQTFRLGDLSGYVKVADVHAEVPGASDAERAAIEAALKAGVFVNI